MQRTELGQKDQKMTNYVITNATSIQLKPNPDQADLKGNGTIVVGLGKPTTQSHDGACILNHKGGSTKARSVTQFIALADDALVNQWRSCLATEGVKRIVIEDLSLDTCFGLKLFFYRLCNQTGLNDRLNEWVDYVSDWEQGFYPDKGRSPRDSVACLFSLLGHSHFSAGDIANGLLACTDFVWELVENNKNPRRVSFDETSSHYRRAIARYNYERGLLRATVDYGVTFQLMLPSGGGNERILTDAIALTESNDLNAILKVLLRNDDEYSWTKRGFSLLALHRPTVQGSGNDMTVSVDPDTYVSLNTLWESLESLEDKRWGVSRPRGGGKGRPLQSYLDQGKQESDLPHQPWYDGRAGGEQWSTLVGAPKYLDDGKTVLGSKLDWYADVLPELWRIFSPIPEGLTIDAPKEMSGKKFSFVRWDPNARRDLIDSPTFLGWLAAQSMGIAINGPLDIPRPSTYQVMKLPGGLALVHHNGVTLFDEATAVRFDKKAFESTTQTIAECVATYHRFIQDNWLQRALEGQNRLRTKGTRFSIKEFHAWQHQASDAKGALLEAMKDRFSQIESYDQTQLGHLLEQHWGLAEHRAELVDMVERFDQVTQQIFGQLREKRDKWLNSLLTGLGAGLFAKEVLEPFKDKFTMNMYEWQIEMFRKNAELAHLEQIAHEVAQWEVYTVCIFVTFFVAGSVLYWFKGARLGAAE